MESGRNNYQSKENLDQVEMTNIQVCPERGNSSTSMNNEDSGTIKEIVDKKRNLDGLNWTTLREEFTWKKMWTDRSWRDIFKNFGMVLLLGLIPSGYDVISDGFLAKDFLFGTDYTRHVTTNFTEPPGENCTHIKNTYDLSQNGSEILVGQAYTCFEKDPIWGYVTIALLIFPGYIGGAQVDLTQIKISSEDNRAHSGVAWPWLEDKGGPQCLCMPVLSLPCDRSQGCGTVQPGSALEETLLPPYYCRRKI